MSTTPFKRPMSYRSPRAPKKRSAPPRRGLSKAYARYARKSQAFAVKRFQQQVIASGVSPSGTNFPGALTISLNNVPDASDFTNLFDNYKITGMRYRFYIDVDRANNDFTAAGLARFCRVWHNIDYNDSAAPTFASISSSPDMRVDILNESRPMSKWYYFVPKSLGLTYNGLILPSANTPQSVFIATANVNVPHYGLKFVVNDLPDNQNVFIQYYLYISLKDVV